MANNALLLQAANVGNSLNARSFSDAAVKGQNIRASQQNMQQNALNQRWAGEDRQREMQERQQQQQLMSVREDLAAYVIARKQGGPQAALQIWQQLAPKYGLQDQDPEQFVPDFIRKNPGVLGRASEAVLADFMAPKGAPEQFTLTPGSTRYDASGNPVASVPAPAPAPKQPRLVQTADPKSPTGFVWTPADSAGGQPAPAPRAQTSTKFSAKEMQAARDKVRTVGIARQQLLNIKTAWDKLAGKRGADGKRPGATSAGPFGGGMLPTEAGSNFDAAVDQFRSTITSLTRTPGVGAMSDYETRLDQSKLPTRRDYESSTEQKIQDLEQFINNLEAGYGDIVNEGQQQPGNPNVDPQDILDAADAILNGQ